MTGAGGEVCRMCGRPFSPTHDENAPGPTSRHPFKPRPLRPVLRVHPTEGFIAVRDQPDNDRPWAKLVPGVSLADDDVDGWLPYVVPGQVDDSLVQRAALVMASHWLNLDDLDADKNSGCVCGGWREGDPSVCPGWDDHLAEALAAAGLLGSER